MSGARQAVPGLTPIAAVLGHEERIGRLEAANAELRQMLIEQAYCIGTMSTGLGHLRQCIRLEAETDRSLNRRVDRLEGFQQGDLRLSEILGEIETRLRRIELGDERLVP